MMLKFGVMFGISALMTLSSIPNTAVASSSNSLNGESEIPKFDNVFGEIVWVIVSLGIVITLLVLTIKWLSKRNKAWGNHRGVQSLGGLSLGQSSSVQIVEIGDRIYILGIGENVTLIDKEDDPEKVSALIEELNREAVADWNFNKINTWFKQKVKPTNHDQGWNDDFSFQDLLQNKLEKQRERKNELESILKDKI